MKAIYEVWEVKNNNQSGSDKVIVTLYRPDGPADWPKEIAMTMDSADRICVGDSFVVSVERETRGSAINPYGTT